MENDSEFLGFTSPCGEGGIPSIWHPDSDIISTRQSGSIEFEIDRDIKHAFPLGSIDNINYTGNIAIVSVTVRAAGSIKFSLIKHGQDPQVIYTQYHNIGSSNISIDLSNVATGLHYMIMYNENRVAHFQELERGEF